MKKLFAILTGFVIGLTSATAPVMATNSVGVFGENSGPITSVLTDCGEKSQQEGGKEGIVCVLKLVVEILSIGVGILGVIGISVSGVQYLTAGGNEEKTRKAKRRLFEIVIGLAVYAVIFALLEWLLPGF